MADKEEKAKEVQIFFEYDPNFRVIAANNCWVGWTGMGDVRIDFFVQSLGIPERVTHEILPDGINLGQEIISKRYPEQRLVRRIQASVLLSISQAEGLIKILQDQIKQYKDMTKPK